MMLLEKDRADNLDEGLKNASQWVNVAFANDGRSLTGVIIFPTEGAAAEYAHDTEEGMRQGVLRGIHNCSGHIDWEECSHTIQMPKGGA